MDIEFTREAIDDLKRLRQFLVDAGAPFYETRRYTSKKLVTLLRELA